MIKSYFDRVGRICFERITKFFGDEAEYTNSLGDTFTIVGVFSTTPIEIGDGEQVFVSADQPVFKYHENSFKIQPKQGDEIKIREKRYRVKEVKHYDNSVGVLFLTRHQL